MANMFGTDSVLYIKTGLSNNRTIVSDSYFTAPCKIVRPFYNYERNMAELMVMSASAGVMEGDCYRADIEVGTSCALSLQGQSYTKIHKMNSGYAKQINSFNIKEGALFDYDPRPSIPFGGSEFISETACHLHRGARYIYSEILSCGRKKSGEQFAFRSYRNINRIFYCGKLIFLDNQELRPSSQALSEVGFFEGYSHQGTLGYFSEAEDRVAMAERLYKVLETFHGVEAGISTTFEHGTVIRLLGNGSDYLERIFKEIRDEIYRMQPD
ncbi:urease accessory protein UreH [Ruminiclostridium hungatei]|uniref:Urease accessory protein UreD n=1 Tax=Ruminiclostridium hungatei TaxID=48256 RepID=A0A1V4SFX4_RUMHU|nr:urease accessory protein UreD [Ruminiclostridium hungatei]OPX42750.1 urease accessory protein UreH [Ruminiclostridium hungatei]